LSKLRGFVISGLFNFFSLVEVPVVSLGVPSLWPEFDDVRSGHFVNGFPEVDVHFPVATVVRAVVKLVLEGCSVPDMIVAFRHGNRVLRPAPHDPGAFLFVAIPPHEAVSLESITNEHDLLVEVGAFESKIVGGGPVRAVLSPPMPFDGESLGKRQNEGVGDALGETREKVQAGMSFPGESPVEVRISVLSPAFAAFAPMVLAVSRTVTVTIGLNGSVAEVTEQVPRESHFLFGWAPVPVGVDDGLFLVVPMSWVVLGLEILQLPEVAVNGNAWLPEFNVLMDMGGVSCTTFHFQSDQSMDIDLSVASLSGHPVGWVLAIDLALQDGAFGLEVLGHASDISGPCSLSARDGVGRPNVSAILTIPMTGHVEGVLFARVHLVTTLHESKAIMSQATPDPGAVVKRRSLAGGAVDIGDAIFAGGRAGSADKVAVEGATHIPRISQSRHVVRFFE